MKAACRKVVTCDLREDFVAVWIEDTNRIIVATGSNGAFHNVCPFVRKWVIDHNRRSLRLRIHHLNGCSCTCREFLSKCSIGEIVLVIGIIVGREDARASQSVMMLLPNCANPSLLELFRRIVSNAQPHSERGRFLSRIGKKFVLSVPKLQGAPTRIRAHTMSFHWEFAIPNLVLSVIVVSQILEELIWRSKTDLDFSVLFLNIIIQPIRCILAFLIGIVLKRTASVASRTYIFNRNRNATLGNVGVYLAQNLTIIRQILVPIFVSIIGSRLIQSIDFAAVNPLPNAEMR